MKKLSLLLLSFCFIACGSFKATPVIIAPVSQDVILTQKKDQLYIKANTWMVENFTSAKSVQQFSDKEAGIVTGKYLLKSGGQYSQYGDTTYEIFAIIKIQVKNNAARITISPEEYKSLTSAFVNDDLAYTEEKARADINTLISGFSNYMINKVDTF